MRPASSAVVVVAALGVIAACGFEAPNHALDDALAGPTDGPIDNFIPDAGPCQSLISTCVGAGERLRACKEVGVVPEETICSFGCVEAPMPHCQHIVPSGGAVTEMDVDPTNNANLLATTLAATTGNASINTDTGEIRGGNNAVLRAAGAGVLSGIDYQQRGNVGMFRFAELTLSGPNTFSVTGTRALALVALTKITFTQRGGLDLQGGCMMSNAGAGGSPGGNAQTAGSGLGAGGAGGVAGPACSGGGGGANAENGARGGNSQSGNGGAAFSAAPVTTLIGGSGGGGGGGNNGGRGGGGGGALQLVANDQILLAGEAVNFFDLRYVTLDAGGCGGEGGPANQCGGGGGAGGTILIEAANVTLQYAVVAANGGGGGGASTGGDGNDAAQTSQAGGGRGGDPGMPGGTDRGGAGGNGARGSQFSTADTAAQGSTTDGRGGGGGGGGGRIRLNTKLGTLSSNNSLLSPATNENQATTVGTVTVR